MICNMQRWSRYLEIELAEREPDRTNPHPSMGTGMGLCTALA